MTNTKRLLELALKGLEAERTKLDDEIAQIRTQLNSRPAAVQTTQTAATSSSAAAPKKRRKMSAEAKKRISEGMKRRYAELRKAAKAR